jgi:uncharacterized protein YecE (DUF72 family)
MRDEGQKLHLGTSGYTYPEWAGTVWPHPLREREAFAFYRGHFSSLELNRSFYHVPTPGTVERYYQDGGPSMTWSVKAHRRFTHDERLESNPHELQAFAQRIRPLLKDGVVLFQLPRSFQKNISLLESFLTKWPQGVRTAFEFRHESWYGDETFRSLERFGVALVAVDAPNVPKSWDVRTADFAYLRLHGAKKWYEYDYSAAELKAIEAITRAHMKKGEVYLFFDNTKGGYGFHNALWMAEHFDLATSVARAGARTAS